jgi:hypothetical protein
MRLSSIRSFCSQTGLGASGYLRVEGKPSLARSTPPPRLRQCRHPRVGGEGSARRALAGLVSNPNRRRSRPDSARQRPMGTGTSRSPHEEGLVDGICGFRPHGPPVRGTVDRTTLRGSAPRHRRRERRRPASRSSCGNPIVGPADDSAASVRCFARHAQPSTSNATWLSNTPQWSRLCGATMTNLRIEAHETLSNPCRAVWASEVASTKAAPATAVPEGVVAYGIPWHEVVAQTEASAEFLRSTGFAASNDASSRSVQCTS